MLTYPPTIALSFLKNQRYKRKLCNYVQAKMKAKYFYRIILTELCEQMLEFQTDTILIRSEV